MKSDDVIVVTPTGILAEAFRRVAQDAEDPKAWWRVSPLLAGTGLAYHLDQLGFEVTPKKGEDDAIQS